MKWFYNISLKTSMKDVEFALQRLVNIRASYEIVILSLALGVQTNATICSAATAGQREEIHSPRLAELSRDLNAGNRNAIIEFWKEIEGKAPLVEPLAAETSHRLVTFLWRGSNDTRRVSAIGGFPS